MRSDSCAKYDPDHLFYEIFSSAVEIPFLAGSAASTGGYSKIFPKPTQTEVAGISGKFRGVPDLVLGGAHDITELFPVKHYGPGSKLAFRRKP
jgi:hypothetical protein